MLCEKLFYQLSLIFDAVALQLIAIFAGKAQILSSSISGKKHKATDLLIYSPCGCKPRNQWLLEHSIWLAQKENNITLGFLPHFFSLKREFLSRLHRQTSFQAFFQSSVPLKPDFHNNSVTDITVRILDLPNVILNSIFNR
jgi:hypothetical protein